MAVGKGHKQIDTTQYFFHFTSWRNLEADALKHAFYRNERMICRLVTGIEEAKKDIMLALEEAKNLCVALEALGGEDGIESKYALQAHLVETMLGACFERLENEI